MTDAPSSVSPDDSSPDDPSAEAAPSEDPPPPTTSRAPAVEFLPAEPEPAETVAARPSAPPRPQFLPPVTEPPAQDVVAPNVPPAPVPRGKRRLLIAGAAGVAAVAILGGAAWAVSGSSGGEPKEERYTSFPAACATVTKPTLDQFVPRAEAPVGDKSGSKEHSWCLWTGPMRAQPGSKRVVYRTARVDIVAYENIASAKSAYDSAWRTAVSFSGSNSTIGGGKLVGDASEPINGLGDQAYYYHRTSTTALGRSGESGETIRVRNLILTVTLNGFNAPADELGTPAPKGQTPLDTATARPGADALAHDAVNALNACSTCRHRV
ncbi:hypothetical protein [Actinomadura oligospora]|uniref:hypothetical protein n=1 Tax=Actinomadura oligospora TaxID=111804 RepID=UPI00047C869F|nr:hypothetical protein [Actinomadura oligospora]